MKDIEPSSRGSASAPRPLEGFVGTEEVAAFLGKPASWLYNRAEALNIPRYKIGLQYRYRLSEVAEWVVRNGAGE
jgi:predicted DNA-binding transcriptional regulator AlpA